MFDKGVFEYVFHIDAALSLCKQRLEHVSTWLQNYRVSTDGCVDEVTNHTKYLLYSCIL